METDAGVAMSCIPIGGSEGRGEDGHGNGRPPGTVRKVGFSESAERAPTWTTAPGANDAVTDRRWNDRRRILNAQ